MNDYDVAIIGSGFVGTSLAYGKWLEFGTSKMDERPWLIPALNGRAADIFKLQVNAINQAIMGAAKDV